MPAVTVAEWAESVGISRQKGYLAVKRCGIPVADGKVDPDVASMLYQKHTRPRANGNRPDPLAPPPGGSGGGPEREARVPGYDTSRARREAAEATMAEIRLAEVAGGLVSKSAVDAKVFEISRALRDGLMNCARRIAAEVAGRSDPDDCEAVIEREHRALLDSMAHAFSTELDVGAEGAPS